MIKFSDEVYFDKFYEYEVGKERLEYLEKALRLLGSFDKRKDIIINDNNRKTSSEALTYLYEIADNNHTSFQFYNFGLDKGSSTRRFRKNFYLMMQRKDSNFIYKYDFFKSISKDSDEKLSVIEVSYPLTDTRVIKLIRSDYFGNEIIIEENGKSYRIGYRISYTNNPEEYDRLQEEKDKYLLENCGMIIEKAKNLDTLNVENVLTIIDNLKNISFCNIEKDNEVVASIDFATTGEIYSYNIYESERKIEVLITDEIKRTVERKDYEPYTKIINGDYEIIQDEVKRLLKSL